MKQWKEHYKELLITAIRTLEQAQELTKFDEDGGRIKFLELQDIINDIEVELSNDR